MFQSASFQILFTGITSAMLAQIIKFVGYLITHRKLNFQLLATTGGMPSSHSAGMVSLATMVGFLSGFNSVDFAVATGTALVVMYDAAGLRRNAGKMAASLNKIMADYYAHRKTDPNEKLKELLGHTPFEVLIGAIFGVAMAALYYTYLFNFS
ncbi:MAG: divergent PAP2 family protein [Candidatus Gastranaerophilales bacterium]|nr:divergent PAP2 family protein [Candidatus Gastranaerophilales bacterium]